jgi:hypothetical protein
MVGSIGKFLIFAAPIATGAAIVGNYLNFQNKLGALDEWSVRAMDACCQMCPAKDQVAGSYFPGLSGWTALIVTAIVVGAGAIVVVRRARS